MKKLMILFLLMANSCFAYVDKDKIPIVKLSELKAAGYAVPELYPSPRKRVRYYQYKKAQKRILREQNKKDGIKKEKAKSGQ